MKFSFVITTFLITLFTSSFSQAIYPKWGGTDEEDLLIAATIAQKILSKELFFESLFSFPFNIDKNKKTLVLELTSGSVDRLNHANYLLKKINSSELSLPSLITLFKNTTLSINLRQDKKTYELSIQGYQTRKKPTLTIECINLPSLMENNELKALDNFGISIVIPTFNRLSECAACVLMLKSRIAAPTNQWEVIIVDDGCTDGTGTYFAEFFKDNAGFENFRVIWTDKKPGVYRNAGWPENSGVRAAKFSHISLCDSDVYHLSDPVTPSLKELQKDPNVLIGGTLYLPMESQLNPRDLSLKLEIDQGIRYSEAGWFVFPRQSFLDLGGNSEKLVQWGIEDTDLIKRLHAYGLPTKGLNSILYCCAYEMEKAHKSDSTTKVKEQYQILQTDGSLIRNQDKPDWGKFYTAPPYPQLTIKFTKGY